MYTDDPGPQQRLTETMTVEDTLRIWRKLSGNPNATKLPTAEEAARMVHDKKGYSFTPYKDGHVLLALDEPASISEGLGKIGETAASLPDANCNVETTEVVLASRGQTADGGFVNPTTGYHNNDDNQLRTGESHMWMTSNTGKLIDGTPAGGGLSQGEGQGFDPNMNPGKDLLHRLGKGAAGLALLSLAIEGGVLARRHGPRIIENRQKGRAAAAAGGLLLDPEKAQSTEIEQLHDQLSIIQWMHNAPAGSVLDESQLPAHFAHARQRALAERYNALPVMSAKQMRQRISQLEQSGHLALSGTTKRALVALSRRHKQAQAVLRAEIAAQTEQAAV
jgi:hypothetical protein